MMSGVLHTIDDDQTAADALEMEDLAVDTDKLHLNLNVGKPSKPLKPSKPSNLFRKIIFLHSHPTVTQPKTNNTIGNIHTTIKSITFEHRNTSKFN